MEAVRGLTAQIQEREREVQTAEQRVFDKRKSIEQTLDCSDAELQRQINDFDGVMHQRRLELEGLQRSVDKLNAEVTQIRAQTDQLNVRRGQAVMLQDQSKALKEQQAKQGGNLQRKYGLPALPAVAAGAGWAPTVLRNFLQNLNNEVSEGVSPVHQRHLLFWFRCFGNVLMFYTIYNVHRAFLVQIHRIQTDCNAVVAGAQQTLDTHETDRQALASQMQKLDVELRLKDEEAQSFLSESNARRQEMSRLSSSRSAIQQCQQENENAQRSHDEFMATHAAKTAQYKKQIKVTYFYLVLRLRCSVLLALLPPQ